MRNRAIATGSSTWWYWLCCSQTAIRAFFFWQLATSAGTLPTPSEPERETEFQTIHSALIKWHCVCWSLHLSYNGTPLGCLVRPEACGASVTMSGWQGFRRSSWWHIIEIHLLMILVTARCCFSIIAICFGGWRYSEISSRVPVVISAAHCLLGQQISSSGGDSLKVVFRWEPLFSVWILHFPWCIW